MGGGVGIYAHESLLGIDMCSNLLSDARGRAVLDFVGKVT